LEKNIHVSQKIKDEISSLLLFMFKHLDENPEISFFNEPAGLLVEINLDDPAPYIGKQGEGLAAIQHLVKAILSKKLHPLPQFMIDIGDYKRKQISILKNIAISNALKVRRTGKTVELSPMSPFARRIIHLTLKEQPQVTTYSIGEGPQRRIVIDIDPKK
jgi:spoIIIJ-associated protein